VGPNLVVALPAVTAATAGSTAADGEGGRAASTGVAPYPTDTQGLPGALLGRVLSPRYGVSLKAELPFGGHRQTDWTLKAVFFATRF
jgi:hypothetical protein